MSDETISRRAILRKTIHLVVVAAVPTWALGCKEEEFACTDVSELSADDAEVRAALDYQDRSPNEARICGNCAFYVTGKKNQCGQCTLVKGPIHPLGYCKSWSAKV